MFRKLKERLKGRKIALEQPMSFLPIQDYLNQLKQLEQDKKINPILFNINYQFSSTLNKFNCKFIDEVIEFLNEEFKPGNTKYCEAIHQIFVGDNNTKKHYIDLKHGVIMVRIGNDERRNPPFKIATLEYFIKYYTE